MFQEIEGGIGWSYTYINCENWLKLWEGGKTIFRGGGKMLPLKPSKNPAVAR